MRPSPDCPDGQLAYLTRVRTDRELGLAAVNDTLRALGLPLSHCCSFSAPGSKHDARLASSLFSLAVFGSFHVLFKRDVI